MSVILNMTLCASEENGDPDIVSKYAINQKDLVAPQYYFRFYSILGAALGNHMDRIDRLLENRPRSRTEMDLAWSYAFSRDSSELIFQLLEKYDKYYREEDRRIMYDIILKESVYTNKIDVIIHMLDSNRVSAKSALKAAINEKNVDLFKQLLRKAQLPLISKDGKITKAAQKLINQARDCGVRGIVEHLTEQVSYESGLLSSEARDNSTYEKRLRTKIDSSTGQDKYKAYLEIIAFKLSNKTLSDIGNYIREAYLTNNRQFDELGNILVGLRFVQEAKASHGDAKTERIKNAQEHLGDSQHPLSYLGQAIISLINGVDENVILYRDNAVTDSKRIPTESALYKLYEELLLTINEELALKNKFKENKGFGLSEDIYNLLYEIRAATNQNAEVNREIYATTTQNLLVSTENSKKLDDIQATLKKIEEALEKIGQIIEDIHVDIEKLSIKNDKEESPFKNSDKRVRNFYLVFNYLMQDLYKYAYIALNKDKVDPPPTQLAYAQDVGSASMSILHILQTSSNAFPIIGALTGVIGDLVKTGYTFWQIALFSRAARNFESLNEEEVIAFIKEEAEKVTSMWEPLLKELDEDPKEAVTGAKCAVTKIFKSYQIKPEQFKQKEQDRKDKLIKRYPDIINDSNIKYILSHYDPYISELLNPDSTFRLFSSTSLKTPNHKDWHINGFFTKAGMSAEDLDPKQTFVRYERDKHGEIIDKLSDEGLYGNIRGTIADAVLYNYDIPQTDIVKKWVDKIKTPKENNAIMI